MIDILNISEFDFFNKNLIKVFDGIAGSAKSTKCAQVLNEHNVDFLRCTATNKLKRDAARRFGGNNKTIAGGLFRTDGAIFYAEEKEIDYKTILIDEILQSNSKIFDQCLKNVGKKNILICTDAKQMLPPNDGAEFLEKFTEFCKNKCVLYTHLTKTLRAKDKETEDVYNKCYKESGEKCDLFKKYAQTIKKEELKNIKYNANNAYICHTNDIEEYLYNIQGMQNNYAAPLIQKGDISSREDIDIKKYPIVPQNMATRISSYLQIENIGSVTRYQGSEVSENNFLYYFVEKGAIVTNREFYTMITRAKLFKNIRLVYVNPEKEEKLKTYNGKKIISKILINVSQYEQCDANGTMLRDVIESGKSLTEEQKEFVLNNFNSTTTEEKAVMFTIDGEKIKDKNTNERRVTMNSLIKKEPYLHFKNMNKFYRTLEKVQIENGVIDFIDGIETPANINTKHQRCDNFNLGIDLHSAYPHILKYCYMPDGTFFQSYEEKTEEDAKKEDLIRFYINLSEYGRKGMIMSDALADIIKKEGGKALYLGSCRKIKTRVIGDQLLNNAYKNKESKEKLKSIHYGYLQKPFLEVANYENGAPLNYVINENRDLEILMVVIQSELSKRILDIKRRIYGNTEDGEQLIDCLYFNTKEDINALGEDLKQILAPFDFRIFANTDKGKTSEKPILYKTYEKLKKRSHKKIAK